MKAILKDLLPVFTLTFVASFMLLLFEPITLYATNPNDFWFNLPDILPTLLLAFLIIFGGIFIILAIIYFFCCKLFKKPGLYYVLISIIFCVFVITYIQGNFLSGSLPGINGEIFKWHDHLPESITSIVLWIIVFGALIFGLIKLKPKKLYSLIPIVSGIIFVMLSTSLVITLFTSNALTNKPISKATYNNFNLASTNQNLFIFLVDATDSRSFDQLLKNSKNYQETFKDFSYYQDTISYYPYTRDSIPFIFNPTPNHNEMEFADFSRKTFAESDILNTLQKENFNMNFYDDLVFMNQHNIDMFQNITDAVKINEPSFLQEILRFDLYKYLPYPLKGKAHIEKLSFLRSDLKNANARGFDWKDVINYQIFQNEPIETTEDKVFHFVHLEGAHIQFDLDENLNPIDTNIGTYAQKQAATFKVIETYINRLKAANVYDNSAIIIMSDHGYKDGVWEYDYILDRFNPILYIKGINETHDQMIRQDKPISFEDLSTALNDLRLKKSSTELFQNISLPRTRTIIYYVWNKEYHMVEYQTDGKAWESDKMVPTGNVYDLKK